MMRFACPHCKASVSAPEEKAGARVYCPRCRQPFQVPAPGGPGASIRLTTPASMAPRVTTGSDPSGATPTGATMTGATIPPTSKVGQPVLQPGESAASSSPWGSRVLIAFAIGLIVGALLGGGIVWAVLAGPMAVSH